MSADPWRFALAHWTPVAERKRHFYADDPVAFAHDCIRWPIGQGPTDYQDEIWAALVEHYRVAVRSLHGVGKTTIESVGVLWFGTTRDGEDWKAPTTASVWNQLQHYLWPEVHKWARHIDWAKLDRNPFVKGREMLDMGLKLRTGEAFAASPSEPAKIEGAHADCLAYFYDEAKTIPAALFDAVEGAFSGAGPDAPGEAFALACSTPAEPQGRFYDIHARRPGLEDWWVRHVTLDEAIRSGRVSARWADQRLRQWGQDSALYQNRVLGEFASADADGVIPLAWVEMAVDRWKERYGARGEHWSVPGPLEAIGVDVSDTGGDQTVFAKRYDDVCGPIERGVKVAVHEPGAAVMATAGRIVNELRDERGARAVVDAIGVGSGVVGRAREQVGADRVVAFIASAKTDHRDDSRELRFADKRSAAWWSMRDRLDPAHGDHVELPPDDLLIGDLTAPHWFEMSNGRIRVESKDDIRKRIGRSTDTGDAVIQAFWVESGPTSIEVPRGVMPMVSAGTERSRRQSFALQPGIVRR